MKKTPLNDPENQINLPFVRSPYNYDRDNASEESGLTCNDASKTIQSAMEETDINTIIRRFGLTGELPNGIQPPQYGDFTNVVDYHTAMNAVAKANEAFDEMPAPVRARFNNDPAQFVDFCSDPKNVEEMKKLGLVVERTTEIEKVIPKQEPEGSKHVDE